MTTPQADPQGGPEKPQPERTLFSALRELPGTFMDLIRAEFEQFKREMTRKLKNLGAGVVLMLIALTMLTFLTFTLLLAAVFGLGTVMPYWAAALVVSGGLLIIIAVLVAIGLQRFKKVGSVLPTETFDSLVEDAHALKGEDDYDF